MDIDEVKRQLRDVDNNYSSRDSKQIKESVKQLKEQAIEQEDQSAAKDIWCLEEILYIQNNYIDAYRAFKSKKYYKGWCSLENSEIAYDFLFKHFKEDDGEYCLEFIYKHIQQYQSIFPYNVFMSPEFIITESKCSICDEIIDIRNPCGHKIGEIYNGEMCTRLIIDVKAIGMSIVTSPVQKYSVIFLNDPKTGQMVDQYDYSMVNWVIERLQSPFHNWDMEKTKIRHPHSRYDHLGPDDECPCESGEKYKDCCLNKSGVLRPHYKIIFSVDPPEGLPMFGYSDSR